MNQKNGYIAITTILIVSVVVLALSTTVALVAIGEGQSALSASYGEDELQLVDGCVEDALLKVRASATYNGGTFTRPEGTCSVGSPISKVGTTWTMTVTSQNTKYSRTEQVIIDRIGYKVILSSRKEQ